MAKVTFTGRNAKARTAAMARVAPLAIAEVNSRSECISNLKTVLGKAPSDAEIAAAREQYLIGSIGAQTNGKGQAGKLSMGNKIVNLLAMPKAKSFSKPKIGRRTAEQQRMFNAGKQRWSLLLADAGYGNAQGQDAKNDKQKDKTRAPHHNSTNDNTSSDGAKPDATPKVASKADIVQHVATQSATLEAFAAKHAALMPAELGAAIKALRSAAIKAEADLK